MDDDGEPNYNFKKSFFKQIEFRFMQAVLDNDLDTINFILEQRHPLLKEQNINVNKFMLDNDKYYEIRKDNDRYTTRLMCVHSALTLAAESGHVDV